jgi:PAS domain S-box-containing protein
VPEVRTVATARAKLKPRPAQILCRWGGANQNGRRNMILRGVKLARSWHVLIRVGIPTVAVAAATALQLPAEVDLPGEPFLLYFVIVLVSAGVFGRTPGFVAVAATTIASVLYFDPTYSLRLTHAVDLLAIEIYSVVAALSVETLCRLVDSALAEKSEAKSAPIQHQEAQARLAAIVTSSADAIVGKTLDGIITSWNEAAERMFGYSADEMIGQSIRRVVPSDRQAEEAMILSRMAQSESIERHEMMLLAKDGRTFDASITISPIRDAEGRNIGCSKIIRDITARKRTEGLLRRQADLLDQSHDAIFTWKIGGGITYWSRGAELLYGYTAERGHWAQRPRVAPDTFPHPHAGGRSGDCP